MRRLGPILFLLLTISPDLWAKSTPVFQDCPDCPKMVLIPESADIEGRWAFSQTEITFDQWQACVNAKSCKGGQNDHGWGKGNRPIMNIDWSDAQAGGLSSSG